jgi:hypothetical protein
LGEGHAFIFVNSYKSSPPQLVQLKMLHSAVCAVVYKAMLQKQQVFCVAREIP